MHIPDGYLSPSTCALLYGTAIPFWYTAFARVKRLLNTRLIPLLAVASAFCFVIMMFNVPLPGGTTGHAVGVGAATVVLGPWASMLSVSIALLIQAVFFGDGGITTFGANCSTWRLSGPWWRISPTGQWRVEQQSVPAPGGGGWVGRLCRHQRSRAAYRMRVRNSAAVVQGRERAPLYAPYALHIAIPAMMLGHLTFAGLAELFGEVVAGICNVPILHCWGRDLRAAPGMMPRRPRSQVGGRHARSGFGWLCSCF